MTNLQESYVVGLGLKLATPGLKPDYKADPQPIELPGPVSQFILPPGQLAPQGGKPTAVILPPGGKPSRDILPPALVIFTPRGQAVQAG